ncbi:MAG: hypothetical protein PHE24_06720 [Patescibacteria group bacterium]|nr:hypothetical protein [Patescibacteria group bacterium]
MLTYRYYPNLPGRAEKHFNILKKDGTMSQSPTFGQGLEVAGIVLKAIASAAKKNSIDSDGVQNKIVSNPGAIFDFFDGLFAEKSEKPTGSILKLLSFGEASIIEACDGQRTIASAKDVFKSGIDNNFKNWDLDKASDATPETAVQAHELIENATFVKMFTSLISDLDKLCLTQDQIIRFCVKYPGQLSQSGATFFLFKMNGEYFVARVRVRSDGLSVYVHRFGYASVWRAESRYRLVVPQL